MLLKAPLLVHLLVLPAGPSWLLEGLCGLPWILVVVASGQHKSGLRVLVALLLLAIVWSAGILARAASLRAAEPQRGVPAVGA